MRTVPLARRKEETTTPLAQVRRLATLTGAPLTVLPGVGDFSHIADPAAFDDLLLAALRALPKG